MKSECSKLSEKYGDTQRQLAEIKTNYQQLLEEHTMCGDLKFRINQLEEENEALTRERELVTKKTAEQYQVKLANAEQQLSELNANYQILLEQSKHNIESGDVLEDYKKRAQLAIKKANASVVKLTEENEQLIANLSSINQSIEEQKLLVAQLQSEKDALLDECELLR